MVTVAGVRVISTVPDMKTVIVLGGTDVVTVVVDGGRETRITLHNSLPPLSRILFAILSQTSRFPRASANAVDGSDLAVSAWISAASITSRQDCTRPITP